MARLYTQKGDIKKAEEWFDHARKVEPDSARVRLPMRHGSWIGAGRGLRVRRSTTLSNSTRLNRGSAIRALIVWHLRDLSTAQSILEPLHRERPLTRPSPICWRWSWSSRMTRPRNPAASSLPRSMPRSFRARPRRGHAWLGTLPRGPDRPGRSKLPASRSPGRAPRRISPIIRHASWPTRARPTMLANFSTRLRSPRARLPTATTPPRYSSP